MVNFSTERFEFLLHFESLLVLLVLTRFLGVLSSPLVFGFRAGIAAKLEVVVIIEVVVVDPLGLASLSCWIFR